MGEDLIVPIKVDGKVTKEYAAYRAMIARCQQTMPSWKARFEGTIYENMEIDPLFLGKEGYHYFYNHMGPAPKGSILDRIENNKGYIQGNLRWANTSESNKNKKNARLITAFGRTQNVVDWAKETGLRPEAIYRRLDKYGWDAEKAVSQKSQYAR